ncbi:MAG TPA: Arc family DNA-binding protein [Candidatus Competibacteraceae bacterium]|mgnify:CR=1 FL=1|nr:Arc family DNA-binding protein [Candidatus Competibacteraceae bacterium]
MKPSRQHPYNVTLRVPVEIQQWLRDQANQNRRSVNAEMLICLEEVRRMRQEPVRNHAR